MTLTLHPTISELVKKDLGMGWELSRLLQTLKEHHQLREIILADEPVPWPAWRGESLLMMRTGKLEEIGDCDRSLTVVHWRDSTAETWGEAMPKLLANDSLALVWDTAAELIPPKLPGDQRAASHEVLAAVRWPDFSAEELVWTGLLQAHTGEGGLPQRIALLAAPLLAGWLRPLFELGVRSLAAEPASPPPESIMPAVALIANEHPALFKNGGLGSATLALAETLADAGAEVHYVFLAEARGFDQALFEQTRESMKARRIQLHAAVMERPAGSHHSWGISPSLSHSMQLYQFLKELDQARRFSILHFCDYGAAAYCSLLAKRQGHAFTHASIVTYMHGPALWVREGNLFYPEEILEFTQEALEQKSVEMSDVVLGPSHYLLNYLQNHGWNFPRRTFAQPYCLAPPLLEAYAGVKPSGDSGTRGAMPPESAKAFTPTADGVELVYFARLEHRKGLHIFCDGLAKLAQTAGEKPLNIRKVVFLGREVDLPGQGVNHRIPALQYLKEQTAAWPWPVEFLTNAGQAEALAYLREHPVLVVVPSFVDNSPNTVLECIAWGFPFLAARSGGIGEMIHADDLPACTFPLADASRPWLKPADFLADALSQTLASPPKRRARYAHDPAVIHAHCQRWHLAEADRAKRNPVQPKADAPFISVCIPTYNRIEWLGQVVEALKNQTYANFEVIIVDDGSNRPEVLAYHETLRTDFAPRGWKLVSQSNQFLAAARNRAVREATGSHILFLDDDNLPVPEALAIFARAVQHSDQDVYVCGLRYFTGDGQPDLSKNEGGWLPAGLGDLAMCDNHLGDAFFLIRKAVIDRLGGFSTDYGVGWEDWEYLSHLHLSGCSLELIPEVLLHYRVVETSVTRSTPHWKNHQRILRPWLAGLDSAGQRRVLALVALHYQKIRFRHYAEEQAGKHSALKKKERELGAEIKDLRKKIKLLEADPRPRGYLRRVWRAFLNR